MNVYLRPLNVSDAMISYNWRNDPAVWQFTGNRPNSTITPQAEHRWLETVINREDEKRFAICVEGSEQYIGNIQLTDIKDGKAQYHVFIGEKSFWGKGLAGKATCQILKYAFFDLKLTEVYLEVKPENSSAFNLYKKIGFELGQAPENKGFVSMTITNKQFANSIHCESANVKK